MSENFGDEFLKEKWPAWQRLFAKLWGIVEGGGYAPLEVRLTTFNRTQVRKARDEILN